MRTEMFKCTLSGGKTLKVILPEQSEIFCFKHQKGGIYCHVRHPEGNPPKQNYEFEYVGPGDKCGSGEYKGTVEFDGFHHVLFVRIL